jgi:hypothetical protein
VTVSFDVQKLFSLMQFHRVYFLMAEVEDGGGEKSRKVIM